MDDVQVDVVKLEVFELAANYWLDVLLLVEVIPELLGQSDARTLYCS